jgi:hypothetical protein
MMGGGWGVLRIDSQLQVAMVGYTRHNLGPGAEALLGVLFSLGLTGGEVDNWEYLP